MLWRCAGNMVGFMTDRRGDGYALFGLERRAQRGDRCPCFRIFPRALNQALDDGIPLQARIGRQRGFWCFQCLVQARGPPAKLRFPASSLSTKGH